ncbi:inhibin alpha chain [Protopterus annectens]|uniref:inhibin alpha chain n=1 Tax=Protopterus annectens TaxID=7888 RepID=UPI001CFAD2E1|nr:inhibin alpha chain [Protopterus annectens]
MFFIYTPLLILLICPQTTVDGCSHHDVHRDVIVARLREYIASVLTVNKNDTLHHSDGHQERTGTWKRQALEHHIHRIIEEKEEEKDSFIKDQTQVILFPTTEVPCNSKQQFSSEDNRKYNYLFQPSSHALSRLSVTAQFWFYVGNSIPNQHHNLSTSPAEVFFLKEDGHLEVAATSMVIKDGWENFHLSKPFLQYLSQKVFILQVRCPTCPCVSDADKMPFILSITRPKVSSRSRRSSTQWSPVAMSLLSRPSPDKSVHHNCHRASVNITFEELGWDKWIVHPSSFIFHYCHGTCPSLKNLTTLPLELCCAAVPWEMKSLRVRTTSDGGYSFKYETIPNISTDECACM